MRLVILATVGGAIGSGARHIVNVGFARAFGQKLDQQLNTSFLQKIRLLFVFIENVGR